MTTRRVAALTLCGTLAACGRSSQIGVRQEQGSTRERAARTVAVTRPMPMAVNYPAGNVGAPADPTAFRAPRRADLAATDSTSGTVRLVAVSGQISLLVDSVPQAAERLRQLAGRLGGYLAASSFDAGTNPEHTARVEIKVPSGRFEQLLNGVRTLGRVESLESSSEDEGEEFVDVSARLRNAQRLEERLIRMAEVHTGRVADLLAVERALAQTREDIERYEGRVRYLRAQTVYSTLSATVHDRPRIAAPSSEASLLVGAFAQAWRNFLFLVAFAIQVSGVVAPLALVALAVWEVRARLGSGGAPFALSLRKAPR